MTTNKANAKKVITFLIESANNCPSDDYFKHVDMAALVFPMEFEEQLSQLVKNPTWDGDVISKSDRDYLLDIGLAVKVCADGEQGYTAANYIGYTVLKRIENLTKEKYDDKQRRNKATRSGLE